MPQLLVGAGSGDMNTACEICLYDMKSLIIVLKTGPTKQLWVIGFRGRSATSHMEAYELLTSEHELKS